MPGATTKKVVLVCPYASFLGFSGRSQREPTLGDAGSVQASRGDVRSARSGEGGQGRMHGEAVTCHLSKEVFVAPHKNSTPLKSWKKARNRVRTTSKIGLHDFSTRFRANDFVHEHE